MWLFTLLHACKKSQTTNPHHICDFTNQARPAAQLLICPNCSLRSRRHGSLISPIGAAESKASTGALSSALEEGSLHCWMFLGRYCFCCVANFFFTSLKLWLQTRDLWHTNSPCKAAWHFPKISIWCVLASENSWFHLKVPVRGIRPVMASQRALPVFLQSSLFISCT